MRLVPRPSRWWRFASVPSTGRVTEPAVSTIAISILALPILMRLRVRFSLVLGTIAAVVGMGTVAVCVAAGYLTTRG